MATKKFEYNFSLSIDENIRNLGLIYKIKYGLDYQFSSKTAFGVKAIGDYTFKTTPAPLVGEQLLRKASIAHINKIYGAQRRMMLESATRLYEHDDNLDNKYWADFDDCYTMFLSPQKAEESLAPRYSAGMASEINEILECQTEWLEECEASVQEVADAVLCYFLNRRANDGTQWDLDLLTSQTSDIKDALREFMNDEIGIQTKADAEETPADTKGVDLEDTAAPKQ